jgi:hypothetical protein
MRRNAGSASRPNLRGSVSAVRAPGTFHCGHAPPEALEARYALTW